MSRKCPHCGEQVGQIAKSCYRCGGSLDGGYGAEAPGGEYRSPVMRERGGPTGRQRALAWMFIALGLLVPVIVILGVFVRGIPSGSTYAFVMMPIVAVGLIVYGVMILRSKTSDINLFRWDLGRK